MRSLYRLRVVALGSCVYRPIGAPTMHMGVHRILRGPRIRRPDEAERGGMSIQRERLSGVETLN
jgi:hypothetical protein